MMIFAGEMLFSDNAYDKLESARLSHRANNLFIALIQYVQKGTRKLVKNGKALKQMDIVRTTNQGKTTVYLAMRELVNKGIILKRDGYYISKDLVEDL